MGHFVNFVNRVTYGGSVIAIFFLSAAMLIMVANVVYRLFGGVIIGTYELTGIFVGVAISFALPYAALKKGHIIVDILFDRFPQRAKAICKTFTSLLGLVLWGAIGLASLSVLSTNWLDSTFELRIRIWPFQCVWILGLVLFCLVLVIDLYNALTVETKK